MLFPRWRQSLVRSLHAQRSKPESKFFQVANAYLLTGSEGDSQLAVENRTMVFRGFAANSNVLLAITDSRSDKIVQWTSSPNAKSQLCWYFAKTREQYRISADVVLIGAPSIPSHSRFEDQLIESLLPSREIIWEQLSDKAKAQFFWPQPKQQVTPADDTNEGEHVVGIPDNFILVAFVPYYVDYLHLSSPSQKRELHCYSENDHTWAYELVNP